MSDFRPGEIVDVTIRGARVCWFASAEDDPAGVLAVLYGSRDVTANLGLTGVTVERVAPAEWPPQPGDVWTDGHDRTWFAYAGANTPDGFVAVEFVCEDGRHAYIEDIQAATSGPWTLLRRQSSATASEPKTAPAEPRTWREGDEIPDDVTSVRDDEGDHWHREGDRWRLTGGSTKYRTALLLEMYGPVTEILPGGAS